MMAYDYSACAVHVTIFSTASKFRLVSNFTELHVLAPAAHSYVLLTYQMRFGNKTVILIASYEWLCRYILHVLFSTIGSTLCG